MVRATATVKKELDIKLSFNNVKSFYAYLRRLPMRKTKDNYQRIGDKYFFNTMSKEELQVIYSSLKGNLKNNIRNAILPTIDKDMVKDVKKKIKHQRQMLLARRKAYREELYNKECVTNGFKPLSRDWMVKKETDRSLNVGKACKKLGMDKLMTSSFATFFESNDFNFKVGKQKKIKFIAQLYLKCFKNGKLNTGLLKHAFQPYTTKELVNTYDCIAEIYALADGKFKTVTPASKSHYVFEGVYAIDCSR